MSVCTHTHIYRLTSSLLILIRRRSLSSHPPNNLMESRSRPSVCRHCQRLLSCCRIAAAVYTVDLHSVTFPFFILIEEWRTETNRRRATTVRGAFISSLRVKARSMWMIVFIGLFVIFHRMMRNKE